MASICNDSSAGAPVYGFLCEQTNIFYAFETYEQYQEFMLWMEANSNSQSNTSDREMMTDEELMEGSERATESIMEVFNDPFFMGEGKIMELEEIDF
jgi:hypothetical protein